MTHPKKLEDQISGYRNIAKELYSQWNRTTFPGRSIPPYSSAQSIAVDTLTATILQGDKKKLAECDRIARQLDKPASREACAFYRLAVAFAMLRKNKGE